MSERRQPQRPTAATCPVHRSSPYRWLLAAAGMLCVGLAAVGVVLPGMPTTVFLIMAAWCFTRSCPWLEERLVRAPLFRPFQPYLEPGAPMPLRARVVALVAMWTAIITSVVILDAGLAVSGGLLAAGAVGSVVIVRIRRG